MAPIRYPELHDRAWLQERYVDCSMSAKAIADEVGCTKFAVHSALKKYGIERRTHTSRFPELNDKEWLRERYIDQHMGLPAIAELVGSSVGNVHSHLVAAGIPLRSRRDSLPRGADGKAIRRSSETRGDAIRKALRDREARGERIAGDKHPRWKGGRPMRSDGYVFVYAPDHPRATRKKPYVQEHVLVMEKHLGRPLTSNEVVHHINRDRADNRLENLAVMEPKEHTRNHWLDGREAANKLLEAKKAVDEMGREIERLRALLLAHNIDPDADLHPEEP